MSAIGTRIEKSACACENQVCHNHGQNPFQTVTPNALLSMSLLLHRVSNIFPYKNISGGIQGHPGGIPRPSRTCVVFANVPEIRCGSFGICPDLHAQAQVRRHRLHPEYLHYRDYCVVFGFCRAQTHAPGPGFITVPLNLLSGRFLQAEST